MSTHQKYKMNTGRFTCARYGPQHAPNEHPNALGHAYPNVYLDTAPDGRTRVRVWGQRMQQQDYHYQPGMIAIDRTGVRDDATYHRMRFLGIVEEVHQETDHPPGTSNSYILTIRPHEVPDHVDYDDTPPVGQWGRPRHNIKYVMHVLRMPVDAFVNMNMLTHGVGMLTFNAEIPGPVVQRYWGGPQ